MGCDYVISTKDEPLQAGARWLLERTNSWHNRGFTKLAVCTERVGQVIDALISLANSVIVVRRSVKESWIQYRWDSRPKRKP